MIKTSLRFGSNRKVLRFFSTTTDQKKDSTHFKVFNFVRSPLSLHALVRIGLLDGLPLEGGQSLQLRWGHRRFRRGRAQVDETTWQHIKRSMKPTDKKLKLWDGDALKAQLSWRVKASWKFALVEAPWEACKWKVPSLIPAFLRES